MMAMIKMQGVRFEANFAVLKIQNGRRCYTLLTCRVCAREWLMEADKIAGCTPLQLLWRVKLSLATPKLLLELNQIIMLALSLLVITALVGTSDLG